MKTVLFLSILALLLVVGCTKPAAQQSAPSTPEPVVADSAPAEPIVDDTPLPVVSDADVQAIESSMQEMDALLEDLNSTDFADSGITGDVFK